MMRHWRRIEEVNEWTGAVSVRYLAKHHTPDKRSRVYLEVYELAGQYYWSANIIIANRPDLSRIAHGTYAATPQALAVAKMRASQVGLKALRAAKTRRHLTRAA